MSYASFTVDSSCRFKRFSHRRRFQIALRLLDLAAGQRVLDYGSGDGHLVCLARECVAGAEYWAYDPEPSFFRCLEAVAAAAPGVHAIQSTAELPDASFDRLACCEVFEHLPPEGQQRALADLKRLARPGGIVVLSVPIEIGPPSLVKNALRWAARQSHDGATLGNVLRAAVGLPVPRHAEAGYICPHTGFDHRPLELLIRQSGLEWLRKTYSPMPHLPAMFNAQIFYLLRRTN